MTIIPQALGLIALGVLAAVAIAAMWGTCRQDATPRLRRIRRHA